MIILWNRPINTSIILLSNSSDRKNVYDGVAVLDNNGVAIVELPQWFQAINSNFRYQITPIGAPAPNLHIAEKITDGRFKIAGGTQGVEVCWQVTGVRKDPWAQEHRLPVEQEKNASTRGYYLHPELYNQPRNKSVSSLDKDQGKTG